MQTLARLWRGEMPLPEAFWGWAVVGGLLVNGVTSAATLALLSHDLTVAALIAGYAPSVPYNVLAAVGVWRAAETYDGERLWAELARIATLCGMVLLTVT